MKTAIILGASLCLATPAIAEDPYTVIAPSGDYARVSYADLDIAKVEGLDTLKNRIRSAARNLCITEGRQPMQIAVAERSCAQEAMNDGFAQAAQLHSDAGNGVLAAASSITIRAQ